MTILPKKKVTKEKNEAENVDKTLTHHSHSHHHPSTSENRHARNSPTRWIPTPGREEKKQNHDPGGVFDLHESASGHSNLNKRRHRSSPHRNHSRKHRGAHSGASATHPPPQAVPVETEYDETENNSGDEYVPPSHPENIEELEEWFESNLKEKKGLTIKRMGEDGACLFRAVADQVYGDQEMHGTVRKHCIDYMAKNSDFYSHYVTEDFTTYLNRKRLDNCHGNHLEMQAMCEIYNRPIEVYQYSLDPINTFHGSYKTDNEPIRISYHRNVHYNSLVDPYKATIGVGLGLPTARFQPGLAEKNLVQNATRQSEDLHLEKAMLEDKLRETDWEVTQETIEEQVARESYLQWLRDNEKRARTNEPSRTASATCSSSSEYAKLFESTASPDTRHGRSPRAKSTPNSAQNSPLLMESSAHSPKQTSELKLSAGSSPHHLPVPVPDPSSLGMEVAGGATGGFAFETHSMMNQYPQSVYADLANWNEDDLLAQVMAQSQREYLDSLKKTVATATTSNTDTMYSPSSSTNSRGGPS